MGKSINDEVYDAGLAEICEGNILAVCSSEPTTRTEAVSTYKLADIALTPGDGNGDFTIGDGTVSGRKVTVAQQSNVDIDGDGTAAHVAICDDTRLLAVTTCTTQGLTAGGTVTVPAFVIEFRDPS